MYAFGTHTMLSHCALTIRAQTADRPCGQTEELHIRNGPGLTTGRVDWYTSTLLCTELLVKHCHQNRKKICHSLPQVSNTAKKHALPSVIDHGPIPRDAPDIEQPEFHLLQPHKIPFGTANEKVIRRLKLHIITTPRDNWC